VAPVLPLESPRAEHEPQGEVLSQCRRRIVLQQLEEGTIKKHIDKNRELATNDAADYIAAFYNRTRRHGHLGDLSPDEFETAQKCARRRLH
jgi:hypothetical protein